MSVSLLQTKVSAAGNAAQFVILENTSKKQRLHIDTISVRYTADATVASRQVRLTIYDAQDAQIGASLSNLVTASQDSYHSYSKTNTTQWTIASGSNFYNYPCPKLWLDPFQKLKINFLNGVVGDAVTIAVLGFTEKVAFTN